MFAILGSVGIGISMLAYLPQAVHLAKQHWPVGVSSRAWMMWHLSGVLIGALALHRHDIVPLQVSSLASAAVVLALAHRYRGLVCAAHRRSIAKHWIGTGAASRTSTS